MKLYQKLARKVMWLQDMEKDGQYARFRGQADKEIQDCEARLPSGAGFDAGCHIAREESTLNRLLIRTSYHHMDEHGYYDGWTEHTVVVTPSLLWGFGLRVTGPDHNNIKDYIHEVFSQALEQEVGDIG